MAKKNADGTVTLKTTGKLASTPRGSGTGRAKLTTAKTSTVAPVVRKQPGRGAVSADATL